jgi:hypothetical protein
VNANATPFQSPSQQFWSFVVGTQNQHTGVPQLHDAILTGGDEGMAQPTAQNGQPQPQTSGNVPEIGKWVVLAIVAWMFLK